MLMRYAMMVAVTAAAVWGAINLGSSDGSRILVDAGHTGAVGQSGFSLWVLGAVATLITLSLLRFVVFGLPSMMDGWFQQNKSWLYTVVMGGVIYGVFYLM